MPAWCRAEVAQPFVGRMPPSVKARNAAVFDSHIIMKILVIARFSQPFVLSVASLIGGIRVGIW
jgi:hypothetical protein